MNKNHPTKTEKRAINILEAIIDSHQSIDYKFNYSDKEMSWDGYISIPKNENEEISKTNFEGRIPVQIKGHVDKECLYINKQSIVYDVDLDDLRAYSTEKGVLYFQIFINDSKGEVFYASLFPSKIADILDQAAAKGNKKSKRIPFVKLPKSPDRMANIVRQFNREAMLQGSVYTPLVVDRIKADEYEQIQEISFTVIGANNPIEAAKRIPSGDICFYGKMKNDKYLRPIETTEIPYVVVKQDIQKEIKVDGEVYYTHFERIYNSKDGTIHVFSPNLKVYCDLEKISFNPVSSIEEIYTDARFMRALREKIEIHQGDQISILTDTKKSDDFDIKIGFFIDLYETLKMIDFDLTMQFVSLSSEQIAQLNQLIRIKRGELGKINGNGLFRYIWAFGDKKVPLIIFKQSGVITLYNAVYTNKLVVCLPSQENKDAMGERIPLFAYQPVDVLSNLYYYDYDSLRSQIDNSEINNYSAGALLNCILLLINVYDRNHDRKILELADYALDIIGAYKDDTIYLLNKLQIKKRIDSLSDSDISLLESIQTDDTRILFGKNVLLGNKELADIYFMQMSKQDREDYKDYPIYTLFKSI